MAWTMMMIKWKNTWITKWRVLDLEVDQRKTEESCEKKLQNPTVTQMDAVNGSKLRDSAHKDGEWVNVFLVVVHPYCPR